jgi:hypothetical protein
MFKGKKIIKSAADVAVASEKLLKDVMEFVEKEIIKIDVRVHEGPLLKQSRTIVAQGLRNLAKAIEKPGSEIKWIDIKKPKPANKPANKKTKK